MPVRRNINHLRYADDTTLMEESEEELKSLLTKVKEESEKVGNSTFKQLRSWHRAALSRRGLRVLLLQEVGGGVGSCSAKTSADAHFRRS